MFAEIKPLLDWLYQNPHWAGFVIFLISFSECLALVGLIIPGTVIMTAIGSLIGMKYLSFVNTALWAIGGAILGDVISFWLGYHFHEKVRELWPLRSFPQILHKGELFFKKHGGKSIFLGRFAGPIRPILPLIAGMMSVSFNRFLLADIPSAILWAPAYLLPGILLGAASQTLAPEAATHLIMYVVLALLALWCISWLLKRVYLGIFSMIKNRLKRVWQNICQNPNFATLKSLLMDPTKPTGHSQLALAILMIIMFTALCLLVSSVYSHGVLTDFNQPVYHFMRSVRTPGADRFFVAVSLASPKLLLILWLATGAWLAFCKYWRAAWHWLALGIFAVGGAEVFKLFIHYPRPPGLLQTPSGWAFPSGHTTLSLAIFGFAAVLISREWPTAKRWTAYTLAATLSGIIMFSRLYLTAHWFTDIIGGILVAMISIALVTISYRRKPTPKIQPTRFLSVVIITFIICFSVAFHFHFKQDLENYTPLWQTHTLSADLWWEQHGEQPLLYQTNRFGKPIHILNVQWAGDLATIQNNLAKNGWYKISKSSLLRALGLNNSPTKQPFFLDQLYEGRKPVLQMAKVIQVKQIPTLIILRLWNASISFNLDTGEPVWVGRIGYHKPWEFSFLPKKSKVAILHAAELPAVTKVLSTDLYDFYWKEVSYTIKPPAEEEGFNWDGNVILIKPRN